MVVDPNSVIILLGAAFTLVILLVMGTGVILYIRLLNKYDALLQLNSELTLHVQKLENQLDRVQREYNRLTAQVAEQRGD